MEELMDISIKARHKKDFQDTMRIAADYLSRSNLEAFWTQETAFLENYAKKKNIEIDFIETFEQFQTRYNKMVDKLRFWSKD